MPLNHSRRPRTTIRRTPDSVHRVRASHNRMVKRGTRPEARSMSFTLLTVAASARRDRRRIDHPATADPAIPARILREVLLVILLGIIELRCVQDLGRDRRPMRPGQRFLIAALA